jgi:hypothetical protein
MIDWIQLAWNSSWIVGLSLALAALSYTRWEAIVFNEKLLRRLNRPATLAAIYTAGMLFSLGAGGTSTPVWQKIGWFGLAMLFLVLAIRALILRKARS